MGKFASIFLSSSSLTTPIERKNRRNIGIILSTHPIGSMMRKRMLSRALMGRSFPSVIYPIRNVPMTSLELSKSMSAWTVQIVPYEKNARRQKKETIGLSATMRNGKNRKK